VLMGDSDSRPASTQQTSVLSFFFPPTWVKSHHWNSLLVIFLG
jgi:hypothetical protein